MKFHGLDFKPIFIRLILFVLLINSMFLITACNRDDDDHDDADGDDHDNGK